MSGQKHRFSLITIHYPLFAEGHMNRLLLRPLHRLTGIINAFNHKIEPYLPAITIVALVAGVFCAKISLTISEGVSHVVSSMIDGYGYVAPLAIFLILTPCLAKLIRTKESSRFTAYALVWLAGKRILSCLWAVLVTVLFFGFPLLPSEASTPWEALGSSLNSLGWMATHSSYFMAIYLGIAIAFLSLKVDWLFQILDRCAQLVENIGQYLAPVVPAFMFAVGVYIYSLPTHLGDQLGPEAAAAFHRTWSVMGIELDLTTQWGVIGSYVVGSCLVGIACLAWNAILLLYTKAKVPGFSITSYLTNYWIRVYPLLWATSSEALATPLNMHLVRRFYPGIQTEVRRLVVGMGSYLNINGTIICVFVLGGVVARMLGLELSAMQLLLCIPVVFLIGYGVPGIPGELVLFAGPMAMLLNIPEAILPVYLSLYIGLQIGLPDSFRTGTNSTDNCTCALLLNEVYERWLETDASSEEAEALASPEFETAGSLAEDETKKEQWVAGSRS